MTTARDDTSGNELQVLTPYARLGQEDGLSHSRTGLGKLLSSPAAQMIGFAIFVLGCIYCWAWFKSGSSDSVMAYLRGDRLLVRPTTDLTFADGRVGEERGFSVRVVNLTGGKVQLLGVNLSCTCITTESFPLTLASGEDREIPIKVRIVRNGAFEQELVFWTDYEYTPHFKVRISGHVEP